jgi:hypothetical protein
MQKSTVLIAILLLTNAISVGMWWRSHQQVQHLEGLRNFYSKQFEIEFKKNVKLSGVPTKTSNGNVVFLPKSAHELQFLLPESHRKAWLEVQADSIDIEKGNP